MLDGFVPWPAEVAEEYRAAGVWRGESLLELLRAPAFSDPHADALVDGERMWTREQLWNAVAVRAAGLLASGLRPTDRVVIQLPNSADFVITFLGTVWAGMIPVLALPGHRRTELRHIAATVGARALCVSGRPGADVDFEELAARVAADVPTIELVIVDGRRIGATELDDPDLSQQALSPHVPSGSDIALFLLSGGTTGLPKLIARTHDDYSFNIAQSSAVSGLGPDSRYLVALPAGHNFPLGCPGLLGTLASGGTVIMAPSPSIKSVFPLAARTRPTISAVVPAVAISWMEAEGREALASLEVLQVGGARMNPEVAKEVKPRLGCTLQQVFGMAEGLLNYTRLDDPETIMVHTQGRKISEFDEIRIVDEQDQPVEAGAVGELLTRGPYTIRGYFAAPDHNEKSFTPDGFYRTGDLVRADEQGNLIVEGRAKDHINRGGEKISAEEIENYVLSLPSIVNAAAIGVPDPVLGDRICLVVEASADVSLETIRQHFTDSGVATFKFPEFLDVVDRLPLTNVGKVDKARLREKYSHKEGSR